MTRELMGDAFESATVRGNFTLFSSFGPMVAAGVLAVGGVFEAQNWFLAASVILGWTQLSGL